MNLSLFYHLVAPFRRPALWSVFAVFIFCSRAFAVSGNNPLPSDSTRVSHALWDTLLRRHVRSDGFVSYKGFVRDSALLNSYLETLSRCQPEHSDWSRAEKMAFWINAYNAFTIQLVVRHYPVKSIKDIKRGIPFVNTVWDIKFIEIGGKKYDLNKIEHGILRPDFKDPRVHAAINCASYSCPPLRREAYTADRLEAQLTEAMRDFINDPLRNRVTASKAEISEIFRWFSRDFLRKSSSIRDYLNLYAQKKLNNKGSIVYLDYNWNLNDSEQ